MAEPINTDEPSDLEIIARAIDPVAWANGASTSASVGLATGVILTDIQEARRGRALATAQEVLAELTAVGRRIVADE